LRAFSVGEKARKQGRAKAVNEGKIGASTSLFEGAFERAGVQKPGT
jgi:hypothetical protein